MFDLIDEPAGQTVKVIGLSSPVTKIMCNLFNACSTNPLLSDWSGYPLQLERFLRGVLRGCGSHNYFSDTSKFPPLFQFPKIPIRPDVVLVGFSAGKDAVAATLKLMHTMGKSPELFYVRGINRAYPGEFEAAQLLAAKMEVPLHVFQVQLTGKSHWQENPVKNQFILGLMVDYGAHHGILEYVQGGLACDSVKTQSFASGFSDSKEMFVAIDSYFRSVLPGYVYHHGLLKNDTDSLITVVEYGYKSLLPLVHSCMLPVRYKANVRKTNEEKYGVKLMNHRCFSCYKCCLEYLHLQLLGKEPENKPATKHCYDILKTALGRILGEGNYTDADVDREFIDKELLP